MSERRVNVEQDASVRNSNSEESRAIRTIKIQTEELGFQTNEAIKMLRANIQFSG